MQGLFATPVWAGFLRSQLKPRSYAGTLINSKQSLRDALAQTLHRSTDGCGLAASSQVPRQHQWLREPPQTLTGAVYIGAIKIRGNLMPTVLRAARGRPCASTACDACGAQDGLPCAHPPGVPKDPCITCGAPQQGRRACQATCLQEGLVLHG